MLNARIGEYVGPVYLQGGLPGVAQIVGTFFFTDVFFQPCFPRAIFSLNRWLATNDGSDVRDGLERVQERADSAAKNSAKSEY